MCSCGIDRGTWQVSLLATPHEVPQLRREVAERLTAWGLPGVVDRATLLVSELVTNVIVHVCDGAPITLELSMQGTYLRVAVRDHDPRALPVLLDATDEQQSGRGMQLVDTLADRWGVILTGDGKRVWCEMATGLTEPHGHVGGTRVTQTEGLLALYSRCPQRTGTVSNNLQTAVAEMAAIDLIADLLHWLRAHGRDPEGTLNCAQDKFEAELKDVE
ncbi:ATP-binding protein [Streptomyces sp. ACA25]|uniref:ATP-binding protein n=1 Tax=Streptomyces sp. ACA25 TaxID=3022596 RepID=UPI0023080922|nr:ATP-binding protein [Streptomyces sp. ACA25]MDB1090174.1 ATP-binding protein [Streptomyces sp. ACA25]